MRSFILSKIDLTIKHYILNKDLKKFGELSKNVFLKNDRDNQGKQFGYANYTNLEDEKGFFKYCEDNNIICVEQKEKFNNNQKKYDNSFNKKNTIDEKKVNIQNPSFYYYKDEEYGKNIESYTLKKTYSELFDIENSVSFELTTLYPGLLVGSGYNHPKLSNDKNDFQLGFYFDHTTGMPIIPASSIKGMLKSYIKHPDFIKDIYGDRKLDLLCDKKIFEDGKTIFYDAYIVKTGEENKGKIFASDYITSHYSDDKEYGEFKEPNPIKFLKIRPDVTFKFQFKCEEKYLELFKELIIDFGLGAKTNTGYGKFTK